MSSPRIPPHIKTGVQRLITTNDPCLSQNDKLPLAYKVCDALGISRNENAFVERCLSAKANTGKIKLIDRKGKQISDLSREGVKMANRCTVITESDQATVTETQDALDTELDKLRAQVLREHLESQTWSSEAAVVRDMLLYLLWIVPNHNLTRPQRYRGGRGLMPFLLELLSLPHASGNLTRRVCSSMHDAGLIQWDRSQTSTKKITLLAELDHSTLGMFEKRFPNIPASWDRFTDTDLVPATSTQTNPVGEEEDSRQADPSEADLSPTETIISRLEDIAEAIGNLAEIMSTISQQLQTQSHNQTQLSERQNLAVTAFLQALLQPPDNKD